MKEFDLFFKKNSEECGVGLVYPDEENAGKYELWIAHNNYKINSDYKKFIYNEHKPSTWDNYKRIMALKTFYSYFIKNSDFNLENIKIIHSLKELKKIANNTICILIKEEKI